MKSFKKITQISLISTTILITSGCVSKNELKEPVQNYLKTNYGFTENFQILAAENNYLVDDTYETYLRIDKPYQAYPRLAFERQDHNFKKDTFKILQSESENFYFEMFKGAYIEQNPKVIDLTKRLIKKYGLVKYSDKIEKDKIETKFMFPYGNIEINILNSKVLIEDFKKTQKIDTNSLLRTVRPSDPRSSNSRFVGVVNFLFEFDLYKNKHSIPKAKDLILDFQKSGVLTQGIYNIDMSVIDSSDDFLGWENNNVALFEVDENGRYTIIATPKYDDLEDSYYYGDYAAKKIEE